MCERAAKRKAFKDANKTPLEGHYLKRPGHFPFVECFVAMTAYARGSRHHGGASSEAARRTEHAQPLFVAMLYTPTGAAYAQATDIHMNQTKA